MKNQTKNAETKRLMVVIILIVSGGCLVQERDAYRNPFSSVNPEEQDQCVTPIWKISMQVGSGGISATSDGSMFSVTTGSTFLFNNKGDLLWTKKGIGGNHTLLLSDGKAVLAETYNHEEPWKSTIVKMDSEGNTLWERQTGPPGFDGLAVTPDGSFIAVGANDLLGKGHLMLFDGEGNRLWNHQIDGRIETVAVSASGYVVVGPRDKHIYVYDVNGQQIFDYLANSHYDSQDTAIAPDEQFFLFGSELTYLNCYTFGGELLWQSEVGPLCNIRVSQDGEYIVVGTSRSTLVLLDKNGTILWKKKVTDAFFIQEVAISAKAEYIAINAQEGGLFLPRLYIHVYNREGEFLWKYEGNRPFKAIAVSGNGHYIAAGNLDFLVFFDNFRAIEEYASSECGQSMRVFAFSPL